MGRLLKLFLFLILIGAAALVGYAYLGDLGADQENVSEPVEFDAD